MEKQTLHVEKPKIQDILFYFYEHIKKDTLFYFDIKNMADILMTARLIFEENTRKISNGQMAHF